MSTIREVAKKAGVSYATVSHVINNTRFVSPETRSRVQLAMTELNYRPNAVARSLRSGRTNTIGMILPDSSNPYFAEIGRAIEEEAFHSGYSIILCNMELDPAKENLYIEVLLKKQVDGIIFVATGDQLPLLDLLKEQEIPAVMIDRDLPDVAVDTIITDNQQGGYQATRHLLELGHRRIACITGPSSRIYPSGGRITGYRQALEDAGVDYDESIVCLGDYHPRSGMVITENLLKDLQRPTAIFACNDLMALGAIRAAKKAGLRIPEDLSIVGFDNIDLANFINPPLTTISQEQACLGVWATQALVRRITGKNLPYLKEKLPTRLIERESTAPVRKIG
jgi:LacI family transcriptional regulator